MSLYLISKLDDIRTALQVGCSASIMACFVFGLIWALSATLPLDPGEEGLSGSRRVGRALLASIASTILFGFLWIVTPTTEQAQYFPAAESSR